MVRETEAQRRGAVYMGSRIPCQMQKQMSGFSSSYFKLHHAMLKLFVLPFLQSFSQYALLVNNNPCCWDMDFPSQEGYVSIDVLFFHTPPSLYFQHLHRYNKVCYLVQYQVPLHRALSQLNAHWKGLDMYSKEGTCTSKA